MLGGAALTLHFWRWIVVSCVCGAAAIGNDMVGASFGQVLLVEHTEAELVMAEEAIVHPSRAALRM